ncbi:MAG: PD40 domain-containing protein [Planctomycetes bacterium]|nr:PD40 domain-containing protein [Planctomycetota bacterium]
MKDNIAHRTVARTFVVFVLGLVFVAAAGIAVAATTERVSVASDGTEGNGNSYLPSTSADGRFVAFYSNASNLVEGDANGDYDVFVHDRQTGQTTRVSVGTDGAQGNNESYSPAISAGGRFVAFYSKASNFVEGDTNGANDVFVRDRLSADVNGDCVVNILDMLLVRNTFLENTTTGDNWSSDVNSDGQIDVMDMLIVRDSLRDECE